MSATSSYSNESANVDFVKMIGPKIVADRLAIYKELLFDRLYRDLYSTIIGLSPKTSLSLRVVHKSSQVEHRKVPCAANVDYVEVLIDFMMGRERGSYIIDSQITPIVMSTIEKSIADFYATPEVTGEMASAIAERFEMVSGAATVVRDEVSGNARWLGKEMSDLLRTGFHENVSSGMAISLGQTVHQFIGSAAGKAMLSTMTKAMAGGMGKVLVTKIASIVASVVGSSAFHTAVVAVVKKIGLTVLVKTVVGKAIIALLALLGISTTVPIAWIILPLIAGLLVWEYKTFPEKLANKVPGEVVTAIRSKFDQLNESVSASVIESVYKQFEK